MRVTPKIMAAIGAVVVAAVVIVASLLHQRAEPPTGGGGFTGPVQTGPAASASPTAPDVTVIPKESGQPSTLNGDEGTDDEDLAGGFDPLNPPADGPSKDEVSQAIATAKQYWLAVNDYGYGDKDATSYIGPAKKCMSPKLAAAWGQVESSGGGGGYFDHMQTYHTRHSVQVLDVVVTSYTKTSLKLTFTYVKGEHGVHDPIPDSAVENTVEVDTSKASGWKVDADSRTGIGQ